MRNGEDRQIFKNGLLNAAINEKNNDSNDFDFSSLGKYVDLTSDKFERKTEKNVFEDSVNILNKIQASEVTNPFVSPKNIYIPQEHTLNLLDTEYTPKKINLKNYFEYLKMFFSNMFNRIFGNIPVINIFYSMHKKEEIANTIKKLEEIKREINNNAKYFAIDGNDEKYKKICTELLKINNINTDFTKK